MYIILDRSYKMTEDSQEMLGRILVPIICIFIYLIAEVGFIPALVFLPFVLAPLAIISYIIRHLY